MPLTIVKNIKISMFKHQTTNFIFEKLEMHILENINTNISIFRVSIIHYLTIILRSTEEKNSSLILLT